MNKLESIIAKEYSAENVYFTGNGTTALYLIFKALNMQGKKIIFPNITCMTPVNAAIYAGYDVKFTDVSKEDFTMDISSLRKAIENEEVAAVVATHIYGHICDMKSIYEICKDRNIVIIEDCAQTTYISNYNDFAITSFGHTKLLETPKGGGAIFFKDKLFKEKFDKYAVGIRSHDNAEEMKIYFSEYYRISKELIGKDYYLGIRNLQINSKDILLKHFKENDELLQILKNKEYIINERNKRSNLYKKYLNKENFIYPNLNDNNSTLWRLSILVKGIDRDKFVNTVRENNIDISTWYPCLHRFYSEQDDTGFRNSVEIENSIINFWITEKYTEEKIKKDIDKINSIIEMGF